MNTIVFLCKISQLKSNIYQICLMTLNVKIIPMHRYENHSIYGTSIQRERERERERYSCAVFN